jgi:hypothetical protein
MLSVNRARNSLYLLALLKSYLSWASGRTLISNTDIILCLLSNWISAWMFSNEHRKFNILSIQSNLPMNVRRNIPSVPSRGSTAALDPDSACSSSSCCCWINAWAKQRNQSTINHTTLMQKLFVFCEWINGR